MEISSKMEIIFDQYQRYETISRVIACQHQANLSDTFRILEIGANEHKDLRLFLPKAEILFTDIVLNEKMKQDPDFQEADGASLPFDTGSFDYVVAADVLEHVAREKRDKFLSEVYRVAKYSVILSFPYNAQDVVNAEWRVNAYYEAMSGKEFIWLKEHRDNGLPDIGEIEEIMKKEDAHIFSFFHGDLATWEKMWYCHFDAAFVPEEWKTRINIDQYYNRYLYDGDMGNSCYRVFYVMSHIDLCDLAQYIERQWKPQQSEYMKNIDVLCRRQQIEKSTKLSQTQKVMNETGEQLGEARAKLAETQRIMNETGEQLGEARAELAKTQQIMNETGRQLGESRAELSETQRVLNEIGGQLSDARVELAKKTKELQEAALLAERQNAQLQQLQQRLSVSEMQNKEREVEATSLRQSLADREQLIADIENSFSWKVTRPLYNLKTAIFFWMERYPFTRRIRKAISILRRKGMKDLCRAMKQYFGRRKEERNISKCLGASVSQSDLPDNREGYLAYDSEYQEDIDFSEYSTDIKALAFYLPQFHTFPENDMWWGKGFTEWVNVRSGNVRFAGHYQPRAPHADIGYYCLDDIQVLRKQAELAKRHGIYGFCFYYYWFSGKRLMEKPVDMLLEHPEIDLPFCLCWANENWTRAWDGQNRQVLISQEYSDRDDEMFISDLRKYIEDNRYIRVNGKPLILVYNPGQIPDCHKSFATWRETARQIGIGEILIWTCQTANNTAAILKIEDCVDAEVEFPPHNLWMDSFAVHGVDLGGKSAFLYNYQRIVDYICRKLKTDKKTGIPVHYGCMMAWDNAARRKDGWFTYYAFSLHSLYRWVLAIVERTRRDYPREERFLFINAWNEWGEGTYLEPDEKYGYANINTVSKGLFDLPFYNDLRIIDENSPVCEREVFEKGEYSRIAVQVHIFYLDTLSEIIENLNQLPYSFDCFVSTDTEKKREEILEAMKRQCRCQKVEVKVLPNRGRDVLPFLTQLAPVLDQYDYIGHVHSKKTSSNEHGDEWRKYIFNHLFGNREYLKRLFCLFENDERIGLIMPETYPVLALQAEWGGNKDGSKALLEKMDCNCMLPELPIFPVGNMFWARSAAVRKIFDMGLIASDFPEEAGQVNGTIAHQIERIWVYIAASAGYQYAKVFNNFPAEVKCQKKKRLGIFVHYDKNERVSEDDVKSIQIFSAILSELIFVTNSDLDKKELDKVRPFVSEIKQRKNIGFDFAAWRDALLEHGRIEVEKFDELVLLNNSCFAPVFNVQEMFAKMENKNLDFWGNTIFPYMADGSYIHSECIPEHLQSYFLVFEKSVLKNTVFWDFWEHVPNCEDLIDVIRQCESKLTKILSEAGFSYQPYIRETYYMSRFLNNYAIPYEKPVSLLLLKDTFVKKKCYQHMDLEEQVKLKWLLAKLGVERALYRRTEF